MAEYMISKRSRNLGFEWSNKPEQRHNSRGDGYLIVPAPATCAQRSGLRGVLAEIDRAVKLNRSNDWSGRLFVAGEPIVAVWLETWNEETGKPWSGWVEADRNFIISEIADGRSVRVRTEEASQ